MGAVRMLLHTTVAGLCLVPGVATAQPHAGAPAHSSPAHPSSNHGSPAHPSPAPTASVPATTVLLPPQSVLLPSDSSAAPLPGRAPEHLAPAFRPRYRSRGPSGLFTGIAPYVAAPFPAGEDVEQWSNGGALVLDVSPRSAQVFVDGVYVGTVQEFNDRGGLLAPGVHAIAIRAPGYGSVNVSVSVEAGRAISYHAGLPPLSATPAAPPPPPAAASTAPFYIIPGCYFGNRRPDNSSLPPGCDPSKVRTIDMRR